jgi:hypothetical protein
VAPWWRVIRGAWRSVRELLRVLDRSRALARGPPAVSPQPWPAGRDPLAAAGQPAIGEMLTSSAPVVVDPVCAIGAGWAVIRGPCMSSG